MSVPEHTHEAKTPVALSWWNSCLHYSRRHWFYAAFLALASLTILILFIQSLFDVASNGVSLAMQYAFIGGLGGFAGTALGAVPALVVRKLPTKVEDTMLGFAAGMMMAASAFSLLLPGLAAGMEMTSSKVFGSGVVVFGMACGVILMLSLDKFTPHEHETIGSSVPGTSVSTRSGCSFSPFRCITCRKAWRSVSVFPMRIWRSVCH